MKTLISLLLLLCLPAGAMETTMDERLSQAITVTEPGDTLSEVLAQLTKTTGVTLKAFAPMADTRVCVHYSGTLQGLMDGLAQFFAVAKERPGFWERDRGAERAYYLNRTYTDSAALMELREERATAMAKAMDQAIQGSTHRWLAPLAAFTDAERATLYGCGSVDREVAKLGGKQFLKDEIGAEEAENWSDDVTLTFRMTGRSPLARILDRVYTDNERGHTITEGFSVIQLCPQFAPETQQRDWRNRYGDPAPTGGKAIALARGSNPEEEIKRSALLMQIAACAGVNLIADDAGQVVSQYNFPAGMTPVPLSSMLDIICTFQRGAGEDGSDWHGSFWRKAGDTYLVRSLAWPEEETP